MRVSKSAVTAIRNAGYRTYYRYGPSSVIICKEYICGACYRLSIIVGRNEQINERAMFAFPFRSSPLSEGWNRLLLFKLSLLVIWASREQLATHHIVILLFLISKTMSFPR